MQCKCNHFNLKKNEDTNLADILTKSLRKVKRVYMKHRIIFDGKVKFIQVGT